MTQSLPASTQFPADWYDDPHAPGGRVKRFWDGVAWTEFVYDFGIDVAVPVPGPTDDKAASITRLFPPADEEEVAEEPKYSQETAADRPEEALDRKIGRFGARRVARQLAEENDELQQQVSELTEKLARFEAELERQGRNR